MAKFKIKFDREGCIGCGSCTALCSDFWEMAEDGKSNLKGAKETKEGSELELDDLACNQDAANSCPVNIIHIIDNKTGKKII